MAFIWHSHAKNCEEPEKHTLTGRTVIYKHDYNKLDFIPAF
jgi:hypothetical protein